MRDFTLIIIFYMCSFVNAQTFVGSNNIDCRNIPSTN